MILEKVLKGTRWLLLKNPENLNLEKQETQRLNEALMLNQPLACAYYLKEDLSQIWLQPDKGQAQLVLADWIKFQECSDGPNPGKRAIPAFT